MYISLILLKVQGPHLPPGQGTSRVYQSMNFKLVMFYERFTK